MMIKMIYIESPTNFKIYDKREFPIIFLSGGITNCEDWQSKVVEKLKDLDVVILNPRRKDFSIYDSEKKQVAWEYNMLRNSTCISFWFSNETVQPIVLYEFGAWLMYMDIKPNGVLPEKIIVGCHFQYLKRINIEEQLKCVGLDISINNTLDEHIEKLREYIIGWWKSEPYTSWFKPYFNTRSIYSIIK